MSDIRHFSTEAGPKAIGPYATAVMAGGFAYLSGMIPVDPATGKPELGDAASEMARVLANIGIVLSELGLSFADIVKTTIFLTDMGEFAKANEVYKQAFSGNYPARSCVQVTALPAGVHVEVEVIAKLK